MLSEKENYMRAFRGDVPEYVPSTGTGVVVRPALLLRNHVDGAQFDIFGVEWEPGSSAIEGAMPKPGAFILDDIRRWRDVIKFPDFSDIDWETMSKKDLEPHDPELLRGGLLMSGQGFFQHIMAFMGFTEGLIACFEEPEEVEALLEYLCDGYLSIADSFLKYYKPDYITYPDDTATERSPFISLETFQEVIAPVWRRYLGFFKDRGYLAAHHNCGRCELFLDDIVDMGINAWNPAQTSNDLISIKKKFGNKLLICGGFETRMLQTQIDISEEEIRSTVKKAMDELAPGGGYAFPRGGTLEKNPVLKQRWEWVNDEYDSLKRTYY